MTQFHFAFCGVLEVDPDIVRVAAANALAGSEDPGSAGFQAGLDYRIGSAETSLQLLVGSLMGSLSSHFEKAGGGFDYQALTFTATEVQSHSTAPGEA